MTFESLCALEPELQKLADELAGIRDDGTQEYFCANEIWYGQNRHPGIKPRLCRLVGWDRPRGPEELRNHRAYEIATNALYDLLPGCRGRCGCL